MKNETNVEINETNAPGAGEKAEDQKHDPVENSANDKKYTDDDVNRIVSRRLAAERKRIDKLVNTDRETSELEERERNVFKREQIADIKERLMSENIPSSLADILNYNSEEELEESYKKVTAVFADAITEKAKQVFKGRTPKASGSVSTDDPIAAAFAPKTR